MKWVLRLESPGEWCMGMGWPRPNSRGCVTVISRVNSLVDKVAASGGYPMACLANRTVVAPLPSSINRRGCADTQR